MRSRNSQTLSDIIQVVIWFILIGMVSLILWETFSIFGIGQP